MTRPAKRGQAAGASRRTENRSRVAGATGSSAGGVSLRATIAATSRATPRTDSTSPRFGVTLSVRIVSSRASASRSGVPVTSSSGSSRIPSCSSDRPSSRAEQSMPFDSTPRSFARRITSPEASRAPSRASGVFMPARTLGAPQTTCSRAEPPPATWQTVSLSASGWRSTESTSPTTTPWKSPAAGSIDSTSRPLMVRRAASAAGSRPASTHSLSQARLIRTVSPG